MRHWTWFGCAITAAAVVALGCKSERPSKDEPRDPVVAEVASDGETDRVDDPTRDDPSSGSEKPETREVVEPKVAKDPPPPVQDPKKVPVKAPQQDPKKQDPKQDREVVFEKNAFPQTVSDVDYHKGAWMKDDCLRCHETGVEDAPKVVHEGLAPVLLTAKCRSCHVLIPGSKPVKRTPPPTRFEPDAFPPMIPASQRHRDAWLVDNCMLCHDKSRVAGAPMVKHEGLPPLLLKSKCRSCHVQVRTADVMTVGW